jgi:deoxyribodipyrimidine photo-lyase
MTTAVAVFTRDLRLHDNPALHAAVSTSSQVIPCFIVDDEVLARSGKHATRLAFLADALADLDASLRGLGGALVVRRGQWTESVIEIGRMANVSHIHVSDDYSAYATRRLAGLEQAAAGHRIEVVRHPGVTVVPPGTLMPSSGGSFFQVFTPYYRQWQAASLRPEVPVPGAVRQPAGVAAGQLPRLAELTTAAPAPGRPRGGETAGMSRLRSFAGGSEGLAGYGSDRDDLAADASSRLSPYLHLGCLSARAVAGALASAPGGESFVRQLAWRDFFHQVLAARPDASWRDYRSRGDQWRSDAAALAAWQAGLTGYPIVDAAMRQLATEGFMHNRARMIAASFLTKDLYLDWRAGAAHFMRLLADADVACNQLNWQWVAGTGTDTSAHRIFNPTLQGRRYDPGGSYVRRYVPELAGLPDGSIHDPDASARRAAGYPAPIVDHRAAVADYRARRSAARH